ncbi:LacI family DNA-binding transcriptional regulator [Curtobacterium sp. ISL-83]|uniref:LacI family DNA-binding transcriptional regulator n=1 Tax=Curtobacterium sp. ISL-83 TaxID=2819145 RepID=UPI001BE5042D|nr:LacI family DNA-binding transcriptional regulator [Curtobacterium sp. ISL-83]MBT2503762.1 LacI family DNA-binding transcriptional regulator [Curtobacterium sp. ISL-83]
MTAKGATERPPRAPTIRDVARTAGVSKSLVSLVLRDDPGVSPERRRAVRAAMRELGYEPNRLARALAGNGTGAIGVLLNDLRNPWYVDLLDGLSTALEPAGIAPLIVDSATNQRVGRSSIDILVRQRVDGIVVVGTSGEGARSSPTLRTTPVVLAGTYDPDDIGADVVVNDDVAGARQATEHLLALGHRHVSHLRGPQHVGELRELGYRQAMDAAGLTALVHVESAGMTEDSGHTATRRLLARHPRPTGIVAYNDLVAIGALSAAYDAGLTAPEDVSVIGYDDTYFSSIRRLSLSSVENGTFEIGTQAATFLLDRIAGHVGPSRVHQVPSHVVVRGTSGPAPSPH